MDLLNYSRVLFGLRALIGLRYYTSVPTLICNCEEHSDVAIPAGPTGPFVLSLSKDRLRVFSLIEIANPRIEYGVAMTNWVRMSYRRLIATLCSP